MKRHTTALFGVLLTALTLLGCSKDTDRTSGDRSAAHPKPSTTRTVVDGLTGRSAVRAGTKARNRIEAVSAKKDEDLTEILGTE